MPDTALATAHHNTAAVLDLVIATKKLKNDAAFGRLVKLDAPRVSKLRHARTRMSGDVLLQIHDTTGIELPKLRAALATELPPKTRR